ncbi:DNA mismatch repair protein MutS, partial [Escherichia coli]|nr:DNA mismatch repair protein MutS [Escherichia coli]
MARKPRDLSADERSLWKKVSDTVTPMHSDLRKKGSDPAEIAPARPQPRHPVKQFKIGQRAAHVLPGHDLMPDPGDHMRAAPLRMDRKTHQRMTRGKLSPQARIDLHGMTLARAHPALIGFILNAHDAGHRLV